MSFPFSVVRGGLQDALPLTLTIDTPYQTVGGTPTYKITGAPPNASIFWSSYKDGQATAEHNVDYGHKTEANGTASITPSAAWTDDLKGTWIKEIIVQDANGTAYRGVVQFVVSPAATSAPPGATPTPSGGFAELFNRSLFELGGWNVTVGQVGLAGLAYWFLKKK